MKAPQTRTDIAHRFGNRMRKLRTQHNLTQVQMAEHLGIDRSFISDVERGIKAPSIKTVEIIALGFKMPMREIFDGLDA